MRFPKPQQSEPLVYAGLLALMTVVFVSDLMVPLGTSVWVIYLFPVALAYFASLPQVPVALAILATVLVGVGYLVAPPGIDPEVARINRGLGILTAWILAAAGYLYIRNRVAIRQYGWVQQGQVGLAERMGGEQGVEQLSQAVLGYLAPYLDADAGAMFVREGQDFRRTAAYGTPADAPLPEGFGPGDGLLGQAVQDRRTLEVRDVPHAYLHFGSGLARGRPGRLLIVPVVADGDVNAVIELGFLRRTGERERALLREAAPQIAIAIRSSRHRTRLQELLEETRRQAEELQAQGEELRAANEELEEQSQALLHTQNRLELQQTELEEANARLGRQATSLESQRDALARAQTSLQGQAQELERASRYKSEFLANMSHELRTPLNSLLIMARLLGDNRDGNLTPEQVRYAETIEESGNDLLALINDILEISKIEAGHLDIRPEPVRIGQLAEKMVSAFAALAEEKGLTLAVDAGDMAGAEIETDPLRVEQVLRNLLSNAVKFTEHGEVTLAIAPAEDGMVAFAVRDTGIGIPPEQGEAIFEAFQQGDGSISRKYGGTGLGLSISRELARLLGGTLRMESQVGIGSTFTLLLPERHDPARVPHQPAQPAPPRRLSLVAASEAPPPAAITPVDDDRERLSGDSRVILVVDDDTRFARILYDLAHEHGFQCLIAHTADDGVVMARQYLPHAIVLDIGLPDHTGLSVLDRLKRDVRTRHIPVHVVSVGDYMQTAMAYGAVGFVLKPVTREALSQALEHLETRLAQRVRRVLIVEDDANQLESIRQLLATRDVEAVGAGTAAACLEELKARTFDCMVLDLTLPDRTGFDLLEELSRDESAQFPPVIVYTGRELPAEEELRLRRYSKSIIIKGARSPERLLDEVTLFLHQVVADLPERQQRMLALSLNRDATLEGRRVLVVEDDVRNIFSLTSILEPHGVAIDIARNGREALALLDGGQARPPVDLVLMDIMMPEMDGLTATREIRKRPHLKALPVIALTAKAMASDQEQCLAAGANDYLPKPIDVDKLLSLVRVWMPR